LAEESLPSKRLIRALPKEIWCLSERLGDRRKRLLDGLDPSALLAKVVSHAERASVKGEISLCWQHSCECPGTARLVGQIPLNEEIFDQLFNGRAGYRAQYYLSPEEGVLFNRDLIVGLHNAIKTAYSYASLDVCFPIVERSLLGPHSKIWIYGERQAFEFSESELVNPPRWVENNASSGRKAPLPHHHKLDLKGTFIEPKGPGAFIDEFKLDRAWDLHRKGYT
jgi:hypothetical protein